MKKIAILGASYLQKPLILKAKEMGLETHVFAWKEGNVVEEISDYYYEISILDKENILTECLKIGIDGIISIASDIAMSTVNYVAAKMDLVGNSIEATYKSTDKYEMRKALKRGGIPCPYFEFFDEPNFIEKSKFNFPVIVKPTDRSGSRGVTKVESFKGVNLAIVKALNNSINGRVIVEEFIVGREFSIEMISYKGIHYEIAITDKVTTGAPFFVEIEHHQPAHLNDLQKSVINKCVKDSLNALGIEHGASHSEVLLTKDGDIRVVEIAARMGGELIGSHMVRLSTGYDFVKGVIQVALGEFTKLDYNKFKNDFSGVYYVLPKPGKIIAIENKIKYFKSVKFAIPLLDVKEEVPYVVDGANKRAGILVYQSTKGKILLEPLNVLQFKTE